MQTIEAEVFIDQKLLLQIEMLADAKGVSRDQIFAVALREFIKRRQSEQITQQLNETYTEEAAEEDQAILRQMRPTHRR